MTWFKWFMFLFSSGTVMAIYCMIILVIIDTSEKNNTEISNLGISYICICFIVIAFITILVIRQWGLQFG